MKRKNVFDLSLEKSFKESESRFKGFSIFVPSINKDKDTYSELFEDDDRFNGYNISIKDEEIRERKFGFFKRLFRLLRII